jgi:hypothetical protein
MNASAELTRALGEDAVGIRVEEIPEGRSGEAQR